MNSSLFLWWFLTIMRGYEAMPALIGNKIEMGDLGTFEITPDFYNLQIRPIVVLPQKKEDINTEFLLYTKSTSNYQLLDARNKNTLTGSSLNVSHPTVFIIHGFVDSHILGKWINKMKDEFLIKGNYNVIVVDWSKGNQFPYSQATANTRVVGAEIAFLVSKLQENLQLDPKKCHLIGHSLGAHIAGYAGEKIQHLGRITALDPAGPLFEGMPSSVTVDPTDAEFVDAIHTDSNNMFRFDHTFKLFRMGLGMKETVGHIDFYPNGGEDQPGCKPFPSFSSSRAHRDILPELIDKWFETAYGVLRRIFTCEHERAVELFTESINSKECKFVGFQCPTWNTFKKGKCTSCGPDGINCAYMGLSADQYKAHNTQTEVGFFLETGSSENYCVNRYEVVLHLGNTKVNSIDGKFDLAKGAKNIMHENILDAEPGEKETYIINSPIDLLSLKSVNFRWKTSSWNVIRPHKIDIKSIKITHLTIMKENEQEKYSATYLPSVDRPFKSKETVMMNLKG